MTTLNDIYNALFPKDVYGTVVFIDTVGRDTKVGKVFSIQITDENRIMKVSIWDENHLKPLKTGQKIMLTKASVSIFQNEPQLSLAKDGKIEIIQ